jgi:hypothetical protein
MAACRLHLTDRRAARLHPLPREQIDIALLERPNVLPNIKPRQLVHVRRVATLSAAKTSSVPFRM